MADESDPVPPDSDMLDIPPQALQILRVLWEETESKRRDHEQTKRHMDMTVRAVASTMGVDLSLPEDWNMDLPTGKLIRKRKPKDMH